MNIRRRRTGAWPCLLLVFLLLTSCGPAPARVPTSPVATEVPPPFPTAVPATATKPTRAPVCTLPPCRPGEGYSCPGECPDGCGTICVTPTPAASPQETALPEVRMPARATVPSGWPALPADLYFLRDGRVWQWPAGGRAPEPLPTCAGVDAIVGYKWTLDGRYMLYWTASHHLFVVNRRTEAPVFPAPGTDPVTAHEYRLLAGGAYLLYLTPGRELHIWDLLVGQPLFPAAGEDPVIVQYYRVTPNGHHLAYVTTTGDLYVLDLTSDEQIPVRLDDNWHNFALSADGRYLVYRSETDMIRAMDVQSDRTYDLGECIPQTHGDYSISCEGPFLSSAGDMVAFRDGRGVWVAPVPEGPAKLLVEHEVARNPNQFCCVYTPNEWSPDGRLLLLNVGAYEGGTIALADLPTGRWEKLPAWCYVGGDVDWAWGPQGLWVSVIPDTLFLAQVSDEGEINLTQVISATDVGPMAARSLLPFSDGRLGFAVPYCRPSSAYTNRPEYEPGLFLLETDGTLRRVASLPLYPCDDDYALGFGQPVMSGRSGGFSVAWTADGSAFLYTDGSGSAILLGLTDGSALWDVRELLQGASRFTWAVPGQADIVAALANFTALRNRAEETLNPELLRQVCVDPYLSAKMARIRANARDGSHWETPWTESAVVAISLIGLDRARVQVHKKETKLFYPAGSTVPDDEVCRGTINSYRDCTYDAEYVMVRQEGRWYVSEAIPLGDCPNRCRK